MLFATHVIGITQIFVVWGINCASQRWCKMEV